MRLTQYPDRTSIRNEATVQLPRNEAAGGDIFLDVVALPPDYPEDVEREIPSPTPPRLGIEKDEDGKPIFDPETGRPVVRYNEADADFQRKRQRAQTLQTVKYAVDALKEGQIEFEADTRDLEGAEYYEAVLREMREYGFSLGDVAKLCASAQRVSGLSEDEIEKATEGFFMTGS